jgi:hypothetical protein
MRRAGATMLILAACIRPAPAAQPQQVLLFQPREGGVQERVGDTFIQGLTALCGGRGGCPEIHRVHRPPDNAAIRSSQLLVGLGPEAADILARITPDRPQLHLLVSPDQHALHQTLAHASALYIQQPLRRQLGFLHFLFPERRRVGVLLGPDSRIQRTRLKQVAATLGLDLRIRVVTDGSGIGPTLRTLADHSDILFALPDSLIYNRDTLGGILLTSYQKQLPVFGFSRGMVRAGAVAALFSSPEEIGKEAAQRAWAMLRGRVPPAAPPGRFAIAVNRPVARALHLHLPTDDELTRWEPTP